MMLVATAPHQPMALAFVGAARGAIGFGDGRVYTTVAGGRPFRLSLRLPAASDRPLLLAAGGGRLFAGVGAAPLETSDDAGRSWQARARLPRGATHLGCASAGRCIAVTVAPFLRAFETRDGGVTWRGVRLPDCTTANEDAFVQPLGTREAYLLCVGLRLPGSRQQKLLYHTDGQHPWRFVTGASERGLPTRGVVNALSFRGLEGYVGLFSGHLLRTGDGGRHFVPAGLTRPRRVEASAAQITRGARFVLLRNVATIRLLRSTDGGRRWQVRATWR